MFKAAYVIVVISENGFSIEEMADLTETEVLAAYHVAKASLPDDKIALYKRIRPDGD